MGSPTECRAPEGTPLYLHLPFCATKCPYCDFFSVPSAGQDLGGFVEAILAEAQTRAPWHPRTVFLGGGTPSLLPTALLARLLDRLEDLTGFRESALEVSAECNPESLDYEKARVLVELGVTRLSIGFQSLRDEVLELFGRVHSAADALRAYGAARAAGPRSVNIDLIFAYPGQKLGAWLEDLEAVLALGPDHLAAYNLAFEEGTPFRRSLEQGRLRPLPEECELELFRATHDTLGPRGLEAYEISNFSALGHQSLHNINYWENGPYAGLGPSAVSFYAGERRGNHRSIGEYVRRVRAGVGAADWSESLSPIARLGETWWLGLRLAAGLDPRRARRVAGIAGVFDPARAVAERLRADGLVERLAGRYRLTQRGLPLADAVAREFLALEETLAAAGS